MEILCDLPFGEECSNIVELSEETNKKISENTLVPRVGRYLALDISLQSSGICYYENGIKETTNYKITIDDESPFKEVLARRNLKNYLSQIIGGFDFELILIEDAFQGINPDTTRKLYALNTAIDELILDGVITCKQFLRVSNSTWKHWLYSIDTEGKYRLLKDKARVEACLNMLGVFEEGVGYQDRLDATGMLLGYFLSGYRNVNKKDKTFKFDIGDICCSYQEDVDLILSEVRKERKLDDVDIHQFHVGTKKLTKAALKRWLLPHPEKVLITEDPIRVGYLLKDFDLKPTNSGIGYFAFWLKESKYKKLIGL